MAVVNTKATAITNADAAPPTINKNFITEGRVKSACGTIEAANGDSIGSTYRFCRVPSWARVVEVILSNDAVTTGAADIGVYDVAAVNSGAVVDADHWGSAVSIGTAAQGTNVLREAGAAAGDVANIEKRLWETLGLTSDPQKYYDVVATLTAATTAAGTVSLEVKYVDGN